jgi:hypothetical protein
MKTGEENKRTNKMNAKKRGCETKERAPEQ